MRKTLTMLVALMTIGTFSGCGTSTPNTAEDNKTKSSTQESQVKIDESELIKEVIEDKRTFILENGSQNYIKDYNPFGDENGVKKIEYTYVDFDGDGKTELVLQLESSVDGNFLVLHVNEGQVYGYAFAYRAMKELKQDGSFAGSNGAYNTVFCKLTFDGNKCNVKEEAVFDSDNKVFEIEGQSVSEKELDNFIDNWHKKADVVWTTLR